MKHHAVQLGSSLLDECRIDAYRTWRHRRTAPAYMRGVPSGIGASAISPLG